jgi:hypothetical protein
VVVQQDESRCRAAAPDHHEPDGDAQDQAAS